MVRARIGDIMISTSRAATVFGAFVSFVFGASLRATVATSPNGKARARR